ncbi:hypothetical protein LV780_04910 [Cereibacter azotoformans]|uniref:hypothetical protein n=1 Tax=Cereibacter azotoformans TaxID=43057 RepID=UPI000E3597CF|nr:hypothetical protein [Cereibacter azotoformans]AXQ93209.1 hypothetical protein D0Z66_04900 [Cereibacter sphaeroides]UIJ31521.1 hypothetical protein LV780_04910 [Cereibacter azotoformans]
MSFFPAGFDPRADVVGALDLVQIDTPDGVFGFLCGVDGTFTATDGVTYVGSSLVSCSEIESAIQGTAPAGEIGLTFFQDPDAPDLVQEVRELGIDYVRGRVITLLFQPLRSFEEFHAPALPPIPWARRTMTRLTFSASGSLERRITVGFETPFAGRNTAPNLFYTTEDHARLTGAPNPSLQFMPRDNYQEQKLFG